MYYFAYGSKVSSNYIHDYTPTGPYTPSTRHVDFMIEGAREHDLDVGYVEQLVALRMSLE